MSEFPDTRVAAIVVNYRTPGLALNCVRALASERTALPRLRAVLVDGGSGDDSAALLEAGAREQALAEWVRFLPLPINGGFGWANNQAMLMQLQSPEPPEFVFLLNPDAEVEPGALVRLVEAMAAHPRAAAIGSQLLESDGSPSGSAFRFPSLAREFARGAQTAAIERLLGIPPAVLDAPSPAEVDWVTGASVLFRTAALAEAGLFDTGFFLYFEETELMWRLRKAGWSIRQEPASRVRHIGGAATGLSYSGSELACRPPLPAYWFASRRRFFTRTRGPLGAVAASLAWLAGHAVHKLRRAVGLGGAHIPVRREGRDLLKTGLWPTRTDRTSGTQWAKSLPGTAPLWMDRERGRRGHS